VTDTYSGIRAAVPGDIVEVLRVDHLAAQGNLERAEHLRRRVRSGECLVHLAGDSIQGFVAVRPAHFFERDFIDLLVVDAAHRRAGIGRALLKAALDAATTDQVFISTNESNTAFAACWRMKDGRSAVSSQGSTRETPNLCSTRSDGNKAIPRTKTSGYRSGPDRVTRIAKAGGAGTTLLIWNSLA
jgi:GNAT superfamily N-acetyltransferase